MGRGGGGGAGQPYVTRNNGRPDLFSGKKKGGGVDGEPDFGANANMIPLGGKVGGGGKQQRGTGKQRGGKVTPHFYSNPMSMSLDDELGSSAMRMKRAARY